jgi:alpha-tubulin suppressor-like RCC1 family protein
MFKIGAKISTETQIGGLVVSWGRDSRGILGRSSFVGNPAALPEFIDPRRIISTRRMTRVVASGNRAFFLDTQGNVVGWSTEGEETTPQTGLPDMARPFPVGGLDYALYTPYLIDAGRFGVGVSMDFTGVEPECKVTVWGTVNGLPLAAPLEIPYPAATQPNCKIKLMSINDNHVHFVNEANELYSFGDNQYSNFGDGNFNSGEWTTLVLNTDMPSTATCKIKLLAASGRGGSIACGTVFCLNPVSYYAHSSDWRFLFYSIC